MSVNGDAPQVQGKLQVGGIGCDVCTWAVKEIETELQSVGCGSLFPALAKKVCSKIPFIAKECESFLDRECVAILNDLSNGIAAPDAICRDIHLCQ